MTSQPPLTPAARHHIRLLTQALAPLAGRVERRFRAILRERRYGAAHTRAFLAITPVAAARARTVAAFLEEVAYHGRRLAKLNVPIGDVNGLLADFGAVIQDVLLGSHSPAREQLHLISAHSLKEAYYQVREAEAQVFYGLANAEAEAEGLDELLKRMVGIVTRAFRARAGRLNLLLGPAAGKPPKAVYTEEPIAGWGPHASYWSFPVRSMALLQLGFDKPYPWLPREQAMMRAVTERCAAAIERTRLVAEARHAEEQERRRIGRALHDDTAQSLLVLLLQLELMERTAPAAMLPQLQQSREIADRAIEDLRRTIAALSPALLDRLGLERALRQLAARFRKLHAADVNIRISPAWGQLSPAAQEVVYRVAQESLQNIFKHSGATRVYLWLTSADKRFRLSVRDNGAGFNEASGAGTAPGKPLSFGLAGMRDRAELLGGRLAVRSVPGKGATVTLELPRAAVTGEN